MSVTVQAVERMVEEWDDHFRACAVCLVEGEQLCYEGEYLTERVVVSRAALRAAEDRSGWLFGFHPTRAPLLPGVTA